MPSQLLFIMAGVFLVICGLVALLVLYGFARSFSEPMTQIILVPDYPLVSTVDLADPEIDAGILTSRANALGTCIKFEVAEHHQIVAQAPTSSLSPNLIGQVIQIGPLEIVDLGETPVQPGTTMATDFGYRCFPQAAGTKWHTIITNAGFETAHGEKDNLGYHRIASLSIKRMKGRIDSLPGQPIYARRLFIVEPVFAKLRVQKRLKHFILRSKAKVDVQWKLSALVHNIGKIHRYGQAL